MSPDPAKLEAALCEVNEVLMLDDDLIPPDAPPCPYCTSPIMIPWKTWWECPRCDGVKLRQAE